MSTDETVQCECGAITGELCAWSGPVSETVVLEYMPEHLISSHIAANNSGQYPYNGAERIRVERNCAMLASHIWIDGDMTGDLDPWVRIV